MSWLFDASSLTARLIDLCNDDFTVQVISQHWQKIDSEEAAAMSLQGGHSALVRQVFLCCAGKPLVYARTVIPRHTAQGARRRYANMGNRPLGAMLFSDRTMRREQVQVARLPGTHEANKYIESDGPVWGRRSVFRVSGKPLMVSEYFLPELFEQLRKKAG
jgi:chorismate--pyruvate lyase